MEGGERQFGGPEKEAAVATAAAAAFFLFGAKMSIDEPFQKATFTRTVVRKNEENDLSACDCPPCTWSL